MGRKRLTTVEAERTLIENKVRREDRKKYIDKIAAVLFAGISGFTCAYAPGLRGGL